MHNLRLLLLVAILLVITTLSPVYSADRVTCYTTWDDAFFYVAFEVQDPDVQGTNTTHMSKPWEDDCIEVFLETDNKRAPHRTPNTFQMSASAAGGSSFLVGEDSQPKPKTIYTFKYARKVQGTLNRPTDRDLGYTIELAIPWREMGGTPAPGAIKGFNVICRMKGENQGFVSLSPDVQTEDDAQIPAKWSSIKFVDTPTVIVRQDGAFVCRKVRQMAPFMDGNLGPNEWIRDMRFQMAKPEPTARPREEFMVEKLALARYFYWYQGDPRKEAPFGHVRREDGSSEFSNQPIQGAGPWFSYDRVQWHKDQLSEMRNAGIDVALPIYGRSSAQKGESASKGLSYMAQALKELKAEGKGYPLVGMFFDTEAMEFQHGEKPDLKTKAAKDTFYGMIKDFFLRVPDEFRASVQTPADRGAYQAYVVVLGTASGFSDLDAGFVEYCSKRFAEDFGGRRLIWIAHSDFQPKAEVMDGYSSYDAGLGFRYDDAGWIDVAAIGPGYDDSAIRGKEARVRSRMGGDTYRKDWDELMAKSPDWLIIDSWNGFQEGSEISPSRQHGAGYAGLTKINMLRFNGMRHFDAKYLKHDTPTVMLSNSLYQVTLTIKNAGTKPWYPGNQGVALACRWFKDGTLYADTGVRLPLQETVLAGQVFEKTMGVRTIDQDGKPLSDGDYELRWDMVRGRDEWFSNGGDTPLCVPVKIGAPSPGFTVVSSTIPAIAKPGVTYNVTLKIRNDGPAAWKADSVRIGYELWQAVAGKSDLPDHSGTTVQGAAVLPADVDPGRVAEVVVPIIFKLPNDVQSSLGECEFRWLVVTDWPLVADETPTDPLLGRSKDTEIVRLVADDYGPKFVASDTPAEMSAGKEYNVNVTLENAGVGVWTKADFVLGYHWYYLDGIEAVWDGAKTPLPANVRPGERIAVRASVTPPPYDGQYYLVWDLAHGDKWVSTTASTRGDNILVIPLKVVKGRLVAQDLDKLYDSDITSFDTNRKDGDADGAGLTFPGEFLPPEVTLTAPAPSSLSRQDGKLWPCGLWTTAQGSGPESSRQISFKYPSKADGAKNALTCKGQSINLESGKYAAVHLLVLSTQDTAGEFGLLYKGKKITSAVRFSAWNEVPKHGEHPAFICLHRHSPDGDQVGQACYLNHYTLQADPQADLTSLMLPDNPAVKLIAITLEKTR